MTGRAASGRAGRRARRYGGLMFAVPLVLVALAVAAFALALAPTSIGHRASGRTGERLLPPLSSVSVPAQRFTHALRSPERPCSAVSVRCPGRGARLRSGVWSGERCGGCS